jgi:hypothetical protein
MAGCARSGNRENILLVVGLMMTGLPPSTTLTAFVSNAGLVEPGAGYFRSAKFVCTAGRELIRLLFFAAWKLKIGGPGCNAGYPLPLAAL